VESPGSFWTVYERESVAAEGLTITNRSEILRSKVKAVSALKIFEEAMHCWLSMLGEGCGEYIRGGTEKGNEKHIAQGVVPTFRTEALILVHFYR
jgi:hypothetical protein